MQNEERQITFNDIPEVLSEILKRFDLLDQSMELIREEVRRTKRLLHFFTILRVMPNVIAQISKE